jgi:hypothetical protein
MHTKKFAYYLLLLTVFIVGCGLPPVPRVNDSKLILGKSTLTDLVALVGQPRFTSYAIRNGEKIKILGNAYGQAYAGSSVPGVFAMNRVMYTLHNDVVVAKQYSSTFIADTTNFDLAKARSITLGVPREQLILELGKPSGAGVFPVAKVKGRQLLIYDFGYSRGGAGRNYRRFAEFEIDENDRVSDMNIQESGAENS